MHEQLWRLPDRVLAIGSRPLILGILNVTPDSFSDGGQWLDPDRAVAHGLEMVEQGADLLDIGGESTRPGAAPVPLEEELRRVLPVVSRLAALSKVPLSIDTSKAAVARQAMAAGASVINDVTALTGDPEMVRVAAETGAGLIVMHMQGTPQTMQIQPHYEDVVGEVRSYLEQRLADLVQRGIERERVAVDPGIGFGKNLEHNLELLARALEFQSLGRPVCLGVSRKGFINRVLGRSGWVEHGYGGTLGVLLYAMSQGAVQIVRVHDVAATHAAVTLFDTLARRGKCHARASHPPV
jgi:dihydropteroate synthase